MPKKEPGDATAQEEPKAASDSLAEEAPPLADAGEAIFDRSKLPQFRNISSTLLPLIHNGETLPSKEVTGLTEAEVEHFQLIEKAQKKQYIAAVEVPEAKLQQGGN